MADKAEAIRIKLEKSPKPVKVAKPHKPPREKSEQAPPPCAPVYGSFDDARRLTRVLLQNNRNLTPNGVMKFLRMRRVKNVDKFPVRIITEIKMDLENA